MEELEEYVDLQIEFNQSKNLFHKEIKETMKFTKSTFDAILRLDKITTDVLDSLIDYTTEKVLQEFCRINQYFSFQEKDIVGLKNIYRNLFQRLMDKTGDNAVIAQIHYENLRNWLEETNPFSRKIYQEKTTVIDTVVCSEYSVSLQKDILHLNYDQLSGPILDIGCGKEGRLMQNLRENGFEAYGIERFQTNLPYVDKVDWLNFEFGIEKWGAIISHLGFSNHFVHNHLREDGNFIEYANTYLSILKSLKIGGSFHYAPDLPFIEKYLDEKCFSITKYTIENLSFKTTVIKRLK